MTTHLGHGGGVVAHLVVTVDAEKSERRHDQNQEQELHQALVGTNEFEHVWKPSLVNRRLHRLWQTGSM